MGCVPRARIKSLTYFYKHSASDEALKESIIQTLLSPGLTQQNINQQNIVILFQKFCAQNFTPQNDNMYNCHSAVRYLPKGDVELIINGISNPERLVYLRIKNPLLSKILDALSEHPE
ncbi:hypothetical protein C4F49_11270 [Sphingobacterium sp. KB22]|uniref:Uncharacterized protein n=1 Tax=Sphingobacterium hungaricum TaxID=2082723 RepID=A0A928UWI0_9SPHI|nr:hypothetical protein [Sphingobacterium hungaricum]